MMTPEAADLLKRESERVYVVHDGKTGAIVHIHRVWTFRGGTALTPAQEEARALELAGRFGHRVDKLRVLQADTFDQQLPQRVDVKARKLIVMQPPKPETTRAVKRASKRAGSKR
jgi:hypothetical protein